MSAPHFDPSSSVAFDLARGQVFLDKSAARVLLPAEALAQLLPELEDAAVRDFGFSIGAEMGRRLAARLGEQLPLASPAVFLEHLGGEWALSGMGSLGMERWGRALVFTLGDSPWDARANVFVASVLRGALQRGLSRDVAVVPAGNEDGKLLLLVVSPDTQGAVAEWLASGQSWNAIAARLQGAKGGDA